MATPTPRLVDASLEGFTPQAFLPGKAFDVRMGKTTMWYDGPRAFWVHGPAGDIHAMEVSPDPEIGADYAGLLFGEAERRAYRDMGIDMRTLMSVADARLFGLRFTPDDRLIAWRLAVPLPDSHLSEHGVICAEFDIFGEGFRG